MIRLCCSILAPMLLVGMSAVAAEPLTVRTTAITDLKEVFATVESVHVSAARARIGGTVASLGIQEGMAVEGGKVIARVEDPKMKIQALASDARIQALVAQRDLARTALDRARNLRETGAASQSRLDEAQTALDVAERQLSAMKAERDVISEQRNEGEVLAPRSGRVLKVRVTEGAVVMAGDSLADIATESYILRISVPERHARFIRQGDTVSVEDRGAVSGAPTKTGTIRLVYPEIQQGRVIADVEVPGLGDFFVGERMRVFVGAGQRQTMVIPEGYVYQRQGVSFVRLQGGVEAVVQPGQQRPEGIEILSGLRDGDIIVGPGPTQTAER